VRTLIELVENAKPLNLTMTYSVDATNGIVISAVADECGITEDAVAQRLFDFVTKFFLGVAAGEPVSMGNSIGEALQAIFREISGDDGLFGTIRKMVPESDALLAKPFDDIAPFDFRKFTKKETGL
jgi:hypothetical protein